MPVRHRRRLGTTHLVLIALLALLGSAATFAAVTGSASAHPDDTSPSVTPATDSHVHAGPVTADFADIRSAPPAPRAPRDLPGASTGTFTTRCGRNENGHRNPDNFIVTPGVTNGAHHLHDYVGNLSTDAFSTDRSLRAAGTTCSQGDRSTYFWPVLRVLGKASEGRREADRANPGRVLVPDSVGLAFHGSPVSGVAPMPDALRVITGDAKALTNGTADARARWTCTGFTDRALVDKYPLCPAGSRVMRLLDFPSCWDGRRTDSPGHRAHIGFPDASTGRCARGSTPVPRLRMTLTYTVPRGPVYAVDSFPEQLRKPVTDHADFENVMPRALMETAVRCINTGRRCG